MHQRVVVVTPPRDNKPPRLGQLVIQFAHGLESGPHGRKYQYMKKTYKHRVIAPDMRPLIQAARVRITVQLLVACTLIVLGYRWLATSVEESLLWGDLDAMTTRLLCIIVTVLLVLIAIVAAFIVVTTARALVQDCVEMQWQCLQQHQPDVIVGSSFGAAIILRLLACRTKKMQSSPSSSNQVSLPAMLLLAPTQGRLDWFTWYGSEGYRSRFPTAVLIVHGAADSVVPLRDSQQWVQQQKQENAMDAAAVRLVVVQDSHALRESFAAHGQAWIQEAVALRRKHAAANGGQPQTKNDYEDPTDTNHD